MAVFCPKCGNKVDDNNDFCPKCGNRMNVNQFNQLYYVAPTNGFAIAGFVCSFIIPILGIIFSSIGLSKSKYLNSGRELSIAGLIISIAFMAIAFIAGMIIGISKE